MLIDYYAIKFDYDNYFTNLPFKYKLGTQTEKFIELI